MTSPLEWLQPRPLHLSVPSAAVRDGPGGRVGVLLPGDPGAVDLPEELFAGWSGRWAAVSRAAVYAGDLPGGAVVCRGSALWVHTGRERPDRLEAASPSGRRLPGGGHRCRSAQLDAADVVLLDDVPVTSPVRTAADLARFWPLERAAAGLLALRAAGTDLAEVEELLRSYRTRPHVRRARQLVRALT